MGRANQVRRGAQDMKRIIFTAVALFGLYSGACAESAVKQLETASGDALLAPPAPRSDPAWAILDDAYKVDFSGNSDGGASRGELVLKRENKPSGYTMTGAASQGSLPALVKTATLGSADFSSGPDLLVRLTYRPDGEDYTGPSGKLLFKRTATPGDDIYTGPGGAHLFTKTATDGETTSFTCADGSNCMVMKLRPWGDEFFVDGKRVILRAACPGGDVFYGGDNTRVLVRVAGPGGDSYYRPRDAAQLPDIMKILKLTGSPAVWRAVLFDHKRGRANRRIIWPVPSPLY